MKLQHLPVVLNILFMGTSWAKLESFGPELTTQKAYDVKVKVKEDLRQSSRVKRQASGASYLDHATKYVKDKFGYLEHTDYIVKKHFSSKDGVGSVYLRQVMLGKEVFNADMNINILTKNALVLSIGNSFSKQKAFLEDGKSFDQVGKNISEYLKIALKESGATYPGFDLQKFHVALKVEGEIYVYQDNSNTVTDFKARVGWLQLDDGKLEPVCSMDIQLSINEWFNAAVSIKSKKLISLSDWTNEVSYRVFPITQHEPEDWERQLITDPHDKVASPLGWHNDGITEFNYTRGNNVYVKFTNKVPEKAKNDVNNLSTNVQKDGNYDFDLEISREDYTEYRNSSMTNIFYINNMMHDILYKYGFDEAAGNFQAKNFGAEGLGGDAVQAYVQSSFVNNNARFSTPRDGKAPTMTMGIYNRTNPKRDSSLENSIIIHEYGHGLSNRLIGGADNPNCMKKNESRSMGEGWSDMLAVMLSMKPEFDRNQEFAMSTFANNNTGGSRPSKYSVRYSTNSVSYKKLNRLNSVHKAGHVWATMLYEVYWNLVDKLSFTPDWLGDGAETPKSYGNTLMLKIIIQSMKLMPCNPSFINARDNMLTADVVLTNGSNRCEIWSGFAKRGLGVDAHSKTGRKKNKKGSSKTKYFENFSVPEGCNSNQVIAELAEHI